MNLIPLALGLASLATGAVLMGHFGQAAVIQRRERREALAAEAAAEQAEARRQAEQLAHRQRVLDEQREAEQAAQRRATDDFHRHSPWNLVALAQRKLRVALAPIRQEAEVLAHRLNAYRTDLAALSTPTVLELALAIGAALFLVVAFGVSSGQLIPSFDALSTAPFAVDVLLGLGVAAMEVLAAIMLARHLRPSGGWHSLGAKLGAAAAVCFAIFLMVAQVLWAPAHDTLPLRQKLEAAQEYRALDAGDPDKTNRAQLLAGDQQQIDRLTSQLRQVTNRDQGLALAVTLGSDVAAWPAIAGLGYLTSARRRRFLAARLEEGQSRQVSLQQQQDAVTDQHTLQLQQELDRLGLDARLDGVGGQPPATGAGTGIPDQRPDGATGIAGGTAAGSPALGRVPSTDDGAASTERTDVVTPDDLFPSTDLREEERRWTDPL